MCRVMTWVFEVFGYRPNWYREWYARHRNVRIRYEMYDADGQLLYTGETGDRCNGDV